MLKAKITITLKDKTIIPDFEYIEAEIAKIAFDTDNIYITYRKAPLYLEHNIRIPKEEFSVTIE